MTKESLVLQMMGEGRGLDTRGVHGHQVSDCAGLLYPSNHPWFVYAGEGCLWLARSVALFCEVACGPPRLAAVVCRSVRRGP
jgi:hypothetical protein